MSRRRASPTLETRKRIAHALVSRKRKPEVKAKISEALKGRPCSAETRAKIREAKLGKKLAQVQTQARRRKAYRMRQTWRDMVFGQYRRDLRAAATHGDEELIADIKRSRGWRSKRRLHRHCEPTATPRVSCGFSKVWGKILWDPTTKWTGGKVKDEDYGPNEPHLSKF